MGIIRNQQVLDGLVLNQASVGGIVRNQNLVWAAAPFTPGPGDFVTGWSNLSSVNESGTQWGSGVGFWVTVGNLPITIVRVGIWSNITTQNTPYFINTANNTQIGSNLPATTTWAANQWNWTPDINASIPANTHLGVVVWMGSGATYNVATGATVTGTGVTAWGGLIQPGGFDAVLGSVVMGPQGTINGPLSMNLA